jgi:ribonuclease P protein component
MTGRIVRSTDFERVLRVAPRAKSAHFALHHLHAAPSRFVRKVKRAAVVDTDDTEPGLRLSTGVPVHRTSPVEDSPSARWLGTVVPKRHARRSVTRSLMKRQMHAAFEREPDLPSGLWVLRLRSAFDVKRFPSAASDLLRRTVRQELDALLADMRRRLQNAEHGA